MLDFDRLFELLEKADYGADCDCRTTTMAYLGLAQAEAYRLTYLVSDQDGRRKLSRAAQYVERKLLANPDFVKSAQYALAFWRGFENGWNEHTVPGRVSDGFKIGRKLATTGP